MSLQFFSSDEAEKNPVKYDCKDELKRRLPREKWLKEHGFEQMSGSTFRLRILIPTHVENSHECPRADHWIGMDVAEFMSFEELETYYRELWVKTGDELVEFLRRVKTK